MKNRILNSLLLRNRIQDLASNRVEVELSEGLLTGNMEKIKGEEAKQKELQKRKDKRLNELLVSLNEVASRDIDGMICKMESKRFIRVCQQALPLQAIPHPT